ncbi:anthranilate phosphoribosyltransferase [Sulfolobus acidocaldarius]|uniref:Anthranilate phosphoribosyltransferase n=3 Tax=Sulfolobus acidocaldarius TaxID=2285 RepID=A0A0U3H892_9CREN|nr:anthranilate phosphoribosyltransferase [Sulfolobus acidocaldarius]AGE71349.1 anthranilate phosphoribosyltransferase [Sulfolobus acidocaldarius N8]AGE73620.1 anthranilate phosphoribosyltransferase [Sulfolobus acidocaldarius Ron12/I]ALU30399.1 anthranilate phosphoribosyltransferase [Sulfolobus acidocaldarius]ALU31120.1 anthranilate phosphoribosyltransferase [Sulfolobus acidocaldarius]WCM35262.1 anthranilate phosphoribosyltransferase [Sulfolobus acidocaldarius DSM 639]
MNISDYLKKIVFEKRDLSTEDSEAIANALMKGEIPEIQVSALLTSLAMKGESFEEIVGFARAMRNNAIKISYPEALDTAGTGGDGLGTINVSTITAIILSQLFPVAKHGNRSVSGKSGSADVLEALGYNINIAPELANKLIKENNFVFLFAQIYHPAMKNVANVRKTLGIRTIFNLLGPLTNPAGTRYQLIGLFSSKVMDIVAKAASLLDYKKVFIYHGEPGIDEISPYGYTTVYEITNGKIQQYRLHYSDFGLKRQIPIEKITATSANESAIKILRGVMGIDSDIRDFIGINVAVGLKLIGKAEDARDGFEYAMQLMESTIQHLRRIIESNGDIKKFDQLVRQVGKG